MKKEELNYYDEFINMANYAIEISKTLNELIQTYNYEVINEKEKSVHEKENLADQNQHKVLNYLTKDFVPPLEREDIINTIRRLDDVVDNIDEIVFDLDILAVKTLRDDVNNYMVLLEKATSKLLDMFKAFKDMKNYDNMRNYVVELNSIEEQGDKLFQSSIRKLYLEEKDAVEVVRWTTIYNKMEDCFDSIEHVAECIDETIMKNG